MKRSVLTIAMWLPGAGLAALPSPVVLGKEPGVTSTGAYMALVKQRTAPARKTANRPSYAYSPDPPRTLAPPVRFPVTTQSMTPGIVQSRTLTNGPRRPICLVGADRRSLNWIQRYRDTLRQVGAVCLIVEAGDINAARKVRQALSGVPAFPASADDLAPKLDLKHYPVLLSSSGVEQ